MGLGARLVRLHDNPCLNETMQVRPPRWSAHYQIQFGYPGDAGEGMTLDLSPGGLCMVTTRQIEPGVKVYARVLISEVDNRYIEYETAIVKWCDKGRIGLQVSALEPDNEHRLLELLCHLAKPPLTKSLSRMATRT